jgi:A/G-specific adenine glycosylase
MNLISELKKFYRKNKREHLPWRKTTDPYKILVSEVMLQQTQVERVIPYYKRWLKEFPTAERLAGAKLSDALKLWSGLGYNRRGKYLWEAAKILSKEGWGGRLPGVGPYTRAAVEAFAFNKPGVFIETNIRTVFTHFYFKGRERVSDAQLLPLIRRDFKKSKMEPRDFYAALMDYGTYLKKSGIKINKQSKHYTKQKKFEGSDRKVRGEIVRQLLKGPKTLAQLQKSIAEKEKVPQLLARLVIEGLIKKDRNRYLVAD